MIIKEERLIRYWGVMKRKVGGSTIGKWKCQPSGAHARLWVDTGNRATRACPSPSYLLCHNLLLALMVSFHFWSNFDICPLCYTMKICATPLLLCFCYFVLFCATVCYCATATGGRQAGVWPPFLSRGQCVTLLRPEC